MMISLSNTEIWVNISYWSILYAMNRVRILSLIAGLVLSIGLYLLNPFHLAEKASLTLAVGSLMVVWWISEAIPLPVTALIPLVLFPLLGIATLSNTASPYANPIIFLFMGGFMIGLAIEKWNLHKRIALNIVRMTGTSGNRIILGFIIATGLLSMWLSNTATTMMMFPIALSVINVMKDKHRGDGHLGHFSLSLMLVIAYASNLGGIATIIGTPPNVAFAGFVEKKYGEPIGFFNWMKIGGPLAILLLICLYVVLTKVLFPNKIKASSETHDLIKEEISRLGPMSIEEKRVLGIFAVTAFFWITKDIINGFGGIRLDDSIIAMAGAIALFIFPSSKNNTVSPTLLAWEDTSKMAWGILILFGGGISLASALENAGLIQSMGTWMARFAGGGFLLILVVTIVSLFLGELMSNIAQVIVFAPVVCGLADALGISPLAVGIPMTLAASCGSMLPMATPPNAIVFSSGHIPLKKMVKAGFVMNLIAVVLISIVCYYFL